MQFNIFQHLRAISTSIRGCSSSLSMSGQGYVPRGRPDNTSAVSGTSGGGPVKQPDGTKDGPAGQTNTIAGTSNPGGGKPQNPHGTGNGGPTNTIAGATK
ncbi:hypothetical protein ARMGADRAFT_1070991 [Armillaria gallica]|uniref:Uncharacterized protein n=1 Tax=Armillaria gallica TaxID=47427 RepID=A0A2H3EEA2_ARMGA|nr:hypothetical protein ARMGADRAFT_1070991 [Armillaria gallica]